MTTQKAALHGKRNHGGTLLTRYPAITTGAGIFVAAVFLRLLFLWQLTDTPFFLNLFSDSRVYFDLARDIGEGHAVPGAYFMSPLYPFLLAGIDALTGNVLLWIRLVQILLGGATAVLVYLSARRLTGQWPALASGLLAAAYPPFLFYDSSVLLESLQTFLAAAQLYVLFRAWRSASVRPWLAAGLLMGVMTINRASTALVIPIVLALAWFRRAELPLKWTRAAAAYAFTALVVVLPWTVRNYSAEGVFVPVTSSGGFNFYAGNNPEATGNYTMPDPVDLYTDPNGERYVERVTGKAMNSTDVSAWWGGRAWAWIGEAPGAAAALFMKKLLLFVHPLEDDQLGLSMEFFRSRYDTVLDVPLPGFTPVFFLALLGFAYTLRESRESQLLLSLFLGMAVSTAVFFVNGRLRVPAAPILMVTAGLALQRLSDALKDRNRRTIARPTVAAVALFGLLILVQPSIPRHFSMEYNKLGELAFAEGDYSRAERHFRASLAERATASGHVNLGNALAASGRVAEARGEYATALALDSTCALGWFNLGNLAMQSGSPGAALGYWTKAVAYQPDLAAAHRNLGLLLMKGGRPREALEHLEIYVSVERDTGKRAEIARDIEALRRFLGRANRD